MNILQRSMSNLPITFFTESYEKFKIAFVKKFIGLNFHHHFDGAMLSFCFFVFHSFMIYYVLAPKLIQFEINNTNHLRVCRKKMSVKWSHTILSLLHALYSIIASSYLLYFDIVYLNSDYESRLFEFPSTHGYLCCFSFGYFLWDLCSVIYNYNIFEPLFILHGFLGVFTSLNSFVTVNYVLHLIYLYRVRTIVSTTMVVAFGYMK